MIAGNPRFRLVTFQDRDNTQRMRSILHTAAVCLTMHQKPTYTQWKNRFMKIPGELQLVRRRYFL